MPFEAFRNLDHLNINLSHNFSIKVVGMANNITIVSKVNFGLPLEFGICYIGYLISMQWLSFALMDRLYCRKILNIKII